MLDFKWIVYHVTFSKFMYYSFGKNGLLSYTYFQMLTLFSIQYQKIIIVNIISDFIRKSLNIRKLSSLWWQTQFSKILILLACLNFIIGNKYCQLLFLK